MTDDELRALDAYWRAANYLAVGQIYLLDNPLLREPLGPEHVKPRLLGHWGTTPGLNFLYTHLEPRDPGARPRRDLRLRAGPRRARGRRAGVPRGDVQRALSPRVAGRGGATRVVPAVLVPGRDPEPRGARDAGLDPRGRRARLRTLARLRRGLRRSGSHGRVRRRRRGGRDRAPRDELALEQVLGPRTRRPRPADPAPERLQDRQPHRARPDPGGRARIAVSRVRVRAPRLHRRFR